MIVLDNSDSTQQLMNILKLFSKRLLHVQSLQREGRVGPLRECWTRKPLLLQTSDSIRCEKIIVLSFNFFKHIFITHSFTISSFQDLLKTAKKHFKKVQIRTETN